MQAKKIIKSVLPSTEDRKNIVLSGRKNYVFLTLVMAITDFKIKYDNSILGYLWSLLKPLLMFGTLYLVFSVFVRWEVENYRLYLLLGIILWNFLSEVTLNSMVLLESKASIVKKIYFPRWIIVIASSLTSLFTLLLNIIVFFIFFIFSGAHFETSAFLLVLYLVELYILVVGLALLLCSLFPKFRDIHHIWEVFVQLGFWATPIIYPISIVPAKYHKLIFYLNIGEGEFLGIIGKNGAGKSTLLKIIAKVLEPTSGTIKTNGTIAPFLELGVGFQGELSVKNNIFLYGALLGMSKKQILSKYDWIIDFSGLERFVDAKLKNLSSGMQVRLGFSITVSVESSILLVDEVLAVGDINFQQKCYDTFKSFKNSGRTILFVSHDLNTVERFCDRALLLDNGNVKAEGEPDTVIDKYSKNTQLI